MFGIRFALLSLLVLHSALAAATSHAPKSPPVPARQANIDESRRILRGDGFTAHRCSSFLTRGRFAVSVPATGPLGIYVPVFPYLTDASRITAIGVGPYGVGNRQAIGIVAGGTFEYSTLTGSSGSGGDRPAGLDGKLPIEEQLQRAGFTADAGHCGVFRRRLGSIELVALVKDGRLVGLVRPVSHPFLRDATVLPGGANGTIRFANPHMRFSLSSDGDGTIPGDEVELFGDLRRSRPPLLQVARVRPRRDPRTGFVVGGANSTATIRGLGAINGQSIADLERRMRPGADSGAGFLGRDERLLDVLARDNDAVARLGLTHQALAEPMHLVRRLAEEGLSSAKNIVYNGQRLRITAQFTHGTQPSPFNDGTNHGADVTVTNLENGKTVSFGLLLPYMIERYGFYEGRGTPYRVEPEAIASVFGFLRGPKAR